MELKLNVTASKPEASGKVENVIVLGSGPAGYSAALYTARAELNPLLFTGMELGGQAALTHMIENYPGFPEGVGGSQLGELIQKQAERFGARVEYDTVTGVDLSQRPFVVKTYGQEFFAHSLVIATGASSIHLNVPGEKEFTGKGVSYCATCDGWFFKGKKVMVVGGGDSALEEALFLTRYATQVTIVHRRAELRAGAILQKRAKENPQIKFILNSVVEEARGADSLDRVLLRNVVDGSTSEVATDGLFIFIGHRPNTDLFSGQVEMDANGYITVDRKQMTSVAGVFAAGEAADPLYRQVVTSAGMGAAAGMMAARFLEEHEA